MPELLLAINAARRDGFTVALHFSSIGKTGKCEVSVLTPCYAHRDYKCEHLCSLLTCSIDEAASVIAGLTQFPC
ncbi:MAG: hypothetical protein EAZ92_15130 [Candidatus Kapaibacterium sp.]|nr:MAG: hypothetical protein EAZ92_15130 [Candidatus Kapabacteria bacterium]